MKQALMNVLIIRKIHHCNLPIFVYFWGPEEDDERTRKALQVHLAHLQLVLNFI